MSAILSGMLPTLAARFRLTATFVVVELLATVTLLSECWTPFPLGCVAPSTIIAPHDGLCWGFGQCILFGTNLTALTLVALLCDANVLLLSSVISCIRQIEMALASFSSLVTPHTMRPQISLLPFWSPKWQQAYLAAFSLNP